MPIDIHLLRASVFKLGGVSHCHHVNYVSKVSNDPCRSMVAKVVRTKRGMERVFLYHHPVSKTETSPKNRRVGVFFILS